MERDELVLAGNRLHYSTYMEDPRQLNSLEQRVGWWLPEFGEGKGGGCWAFNCMNEGSSVDLL